MFRKHRNPPLSTTFFLYLISTPSVILCRTFDRTPVFSCLSHKSWPLSQQNRSISSNPVLQDPILVCFHLCPYFPTKHFPLESPSTVDQAYVLSPSCLVHVSLNVILVDQVTLIKLLMGKNSDRKKYCENLYLISVGERSNTIQKYRIQKYSLAILS